jgi:hypothetical protein
VITKACRQKTRAHGDNLIKEKEEEEEEVVEMAQ